LKTPRSGAPSLEKEGQRHQGSLTPAPDLRGNERGRCGWGGCTRTDGKRAKYPETVYNSIETLLPKAYEGKEGGKLLELWAGKDCTRAGWTSVHQLAQN